MNAEYWETQYNQFCRKSHSPFAEYVYSEYLYLHPNEVILDLGCGDGQDSIYFMKNGMSVIAFDQVIPKSFYNKYHTNIRIIKSNIINFNYPICVNHIFARFFFHAIDDQEEHIALSLISKALVKGGLLFIETRTVNNQLHNIGKPCGNNIQYLDGHYRRFISPERFKERLELLGFKIIYMIESKGFSVQEDDQLFLRIVCVKY